MKATHDEYKFMVMNDEISCVEEDGIEAPLLYVDNGLDARCVYSIWSVEDVVQCFILRYGEAGMFSVAKEKIIDEIYGVSSITYEEEEYLLRPTLHFSDGSAWDFEIDIDDEDKGEKTISGLKAVVEETAKYLFVTGQAFTPDDVCFEGEHWA